jgi:hypothetical protein
MLIYLGQSGGIVVLYDSTNHQAIHLSASTIILRLGTAEPRRRPALDATKQISAQRVLTSERGWRVLVLRLPRALRALATRRTVTEDRPHPVVKLEPAPPGEPSSSSLAVPPTCHKQRSPAVSRGQPRSLRGGQRPGRSFLTWGGGGARNCMACKGSSGAPELHLDWTLIDLGVGMAGCAARPRRWVPLTGRRPCLTSGPPRHA